MNARRIVVLGGATLLTLASASAVLKAQSAARLTPPTTLPRLLATGGPKLEQLASDRFTLYSELPPSATLSLLESLEEALAHATELLGKKLSSSAPVPVIITASPTRFTPLLSPSSKGFRGVLADGSSFIILVVNDSVRPYTRHEVMHDVAFKLWGATHEGGSWMSEAIATFADGQCQGVPNIVVARDLLMDQPKLTIDDLAKRFWEMGAINRHATYVLGASVIEFLWESAGREIVRRVWQTGEWPRIASLGGSPFAADLSDRWRSYVATVAGNRPGLDLERLRRNGCG